MLSANAFNLDQAKILWQRITKGCEIIPIVSDRFIWYCDYRMMAETSLETEGYDYDSFDDDADNDSDRPTERWAPLGAVSNPEPSTSSVELR